MKVQVLGSSSGESVPDRYASAYWIAYDRYELLVDTGDGVAQQVIRFGINPCALDAVIISHMHPDHAGGLFTLLQRMYISKRTKPLQIYVPEGVLPGFRQVFPYFNIFTERWPFRFDCSPIVDGMLIQNEFFIVEAVHNGHVQHYEEFAKKYGFRAESFSFAFTDPQNRKLIYTADIDNIHMLQPLAMHTNALLSECTHVEPDDVIQFAVKNHIDRVFFTHIPPEREKQMEAFHSSKVRIKIMHDGDIIEV